MARTALDPTITARARTVVLALGIGLGGLAFGYALTLTAALAFQFAGVSLTPSSSIVLSVVLLQGVAFGSVAFAYARYRDAAERFITFHVPSLRELALAFGGWVGALAALIVIGIVLQSTGAPTASNQIANYGLEHPEVLLLLIPLSFLLVGPGEELLFRGVVQGTLRERFGAVPAVLIASLIFASVHFTSLSGALAGRVVTIAALFVISLFLGALYEYTENLTVPALVHGAYNATQFLVLYVSIEYSDQLQNAAAFLG
ncbi:CPBP family intramembrane glutamic endopeptidase [Halarchaeum sp. P4]|uniref:CPBP family intramembrane glutamic endopeptidase n=1 Tax=Halarchaeum sp. P4 TaxID=3421639 RepID=UPI003EBBD9ED